MQQSFGLTLLRLEHRITPTAAPPTGLTALGTSASTILLSWNPSPEPSVTGYDVYSKVWVVPTHGGKGSPTGGHYVYNLLATPTTNSATISGLTTGKTYAYVVTAVDPTGQSPYSSPASAETWVAPSTPYGSEFELSNGAVWSGPVDVTAGTSVQIDLLLAGNPLNYSVENNPSNVSVDPRGVVTYTPETNEVGLNSFTFDGANALGSVSQTIQFNVVAPDPTKVIPTIVLNGGNFTYDTYGHPATATAFGTDGVTPVNGTFQYAYNGGPGNPVNAGVYSVLATFTSNDSNYGPATAFGSVMIGKGTPVIGGVSDQTITVGASSISTSGYMTFGPNVPAGENVVVTLNGAVVASGLSVGGVFSAGFNTAALAVGSYPIAYAFAGDANLNPAAVVTSMLNVIPTQPPQVTLNPVNHTLEAPDPVTFTSAATGSPNPNCQWQVSTDGGATFNNIAGATNTTYTISSTYGGLNGNYYRAVFSNGVGSPAVTTAAKLTVQYAPTITANPADQSVAVGQTATFTAQASANPASTVQWQKSVSGGAFVNVTGATSKTYALSPGLTDSDTKYRAAFANDVGTTYTTAATLTVSAPISVVSVQVNNGDPQRSEVRSITVTFSGPVTFAGGNVAAAFGLLHLQDGVGVSDLAATSSTIGSGQTVVMLTFATTGNSASEIDPMSALNGGAASLADGRYQLSISAVAVIGPTGAALDGDGDGVAGGNYISPADTYGGSGTHLYRLFGDVNGDGVVDPTDLTPLRGAFNANSSQSNYIVALDANNDGVIDPTDLNQFRTRFNTNVF
jgi:hypothetical protein